MGIGSSRLVISFASVLLAISGLGQALAAPQEPPVPPSLVPVDGRSTLEFLNPGPIPLKIEEVVGLADGNKLEVLTPDRVYKLALVRARSGKPSRSETLDPKALDAEAVRLEVGDFARFRDEFLKDNGPVGFRDPSSGLLDLACQIQKLGNACQSLARAEQLVGVSLEMIKGESSGISPVDLEQVRGSVQHGRLDLIDKTMRYRDRLDEFKVELGLSPGAPVVVDQGLLVGFQSMFEAVDRWSTSPRRDFEKLDTIASQVPKLGTLIIDGQIVEDSATLPFEKQVKGWARTAAREDVAKELQIRHRLRKLFELRMNYKAELRLFVLTVREKDGVQERLIAPPSPPGVSATGIITSLIRAQEKIQIAQDRLVTTWTTYQTIKLALYRDLGQLPSGGGWKSFLDDFQTQAVTIQPMEDASKRVNPPGPSNVVPPPPLPPQSGR